MPAVPAVTCWYLEGLKAVLLALGYVRGKQANAKDLVQCVRHALAFGGLLGVHALVLGVDGIHQKAEWLRGFVSGFLVSSTPMCCSTLAAPALVTAASSWQCTITKLHNGVRLVVSFSYPGRLAHLLRSCRQKADGFGRSWCTCRIPVVPLSNGPWC